LTLVGLSLILGRWLGMVVSSKNNATTGCAPVYNYSKLNKT